MIRASTPDAVLCVRARPPSDHNVNEVMNVGLRLGRQKWQEYLQHRLHRHEEFLVFWFAFKHL